MARVLTVLSVVLLTACGSDTPPAGPTQSSGTLSLSGIVRDSLNNQPVPGVNLLVLDGPALNRTTQTDANGNYSLTGLPSAAFNVRYSRIGYTSAERGVNLTQNVRLDVSLVPVPVPPSAQDLRPIADRRVDD